MMAYMKICPDCKIKSFSSSKGSWVCPECGKDISDIDTSPINTGDK